uniref:Ig-like domain-containing protein n=1 Tax=Crocodylus porosus TaxID=8502 RepID=A0A7M4FWY4_CROPO
EKGSSGTFILLIRWILCLLRLCSVQVIPSKVQSTKEGKNATFLCHLISKHDVLQVTWQKENGKKENNIATYSKINGHKILDNYAGHINFTQRELKVSAITFHAVTMQDEGCYKCIFNTFPMGSVFGRMCLKVYGKTSSVFRGLF